MRLGLDLLSVGSFGDKRDGIALPLLVRLFQFLHLDHPLHHELILALLISVALVLALPWQVKLGLPALVEWNEQVCALVSIGQGHLRFHHFLSCCDHWLRWSFYLHLQIVVWRSLRVFLSLAKNDSLGACWYEITNRAAPTHHLQALTGSDSQAQNSTKRPKMKYTITNIQCWDNQKISNVL